MIKKEINLSNKNTLISIIMPSYNSGDYIRYAIKSVLAQTYENWELIIVDNKSTDNTIKIVNEYLFSNKRIKLIKSLKNRGPGFARNKGIRHSKGNYIGFLDSDDFWDSEFLERLIKFSIINSYYFVYCPYYIYSEGKSKLNKVLPYANVPNILKCNPLSCLGVLIKKENLIYEFNISFNTHEDIDLWIRIISDNGSAHRYNKPLAYYRQRKRSLSSNKLVNAIHRWIFLRKIMKFNFFKTIFYFLSYLSYGINKYFLKKLI